MTKVVEHVRTFGDMVVTMGLETAKVTPDAERADAGKMTYRRSLKCGRFGADLGRKLSATQIT